MPTMQPTHNSALSKILAGDRSIEERLRMAKFVMQERETFAPPEFPGRPAIICGDDELNEAYSVAKKGGAITADRLRDLRTFSKWRMAVWRAEETAGTRLATLCDAALVFERDGQDEKAQELFSFAQERYQAFGFVAVACPREGTWKVLCDWCLARAKNTTLLPRQLRTMRRARKISDFGSSAWAPGKAPWKG